jgi:predicted RNA-binding Zn-ribbon protein involved in translation (DUF1610 family)
MELLKLTMMYDIDNNAKGFEIKRLLTEYGVPYTSLGSGTNRFGILIDGYAVKFALDADGMIDNQREFLYSKKLYPYVVKCYEAFPNGLCAVTEYVEIFNLDAFYRYQDKMKEILSEISKVYLIGDVGVTTKNYINWGIRHGGNADEICIMDFAYTYAVKYGIFKCSCDNETLLQYDKDYVNFICPRCGRKYTFGEIRRKVTRKAQSEEIGDISQIGYNLHTDSELLPIDPRFTIDDKKKKEKILTPNEIKIQQYLDAEKERQKMLDIFDHPELYDQITDEAQFND